MQIFLEFVLPDFYYIFNQISSCVEFPRHFFEAGVFHFEGGKFVSHFIFEFVFPFYEKISGGFYFYVFDAYFIEELCLLFL